MHDDDYIDPEHATRLRITQEDTERFQIDAVCEHGGYTESVWDWDYDADGYIATLPRAIELAQEFARENAPHLVGTRPKVSADLLTP